MTNLIHQFTIRLLFALLSILVVVEGVRAAPLTRDAAFGIEGLAQTPLDGWQMTESIAVQADDKIVVAGRSNPRVLDPYSGLIARYLESGVLDPEFGSEVPGMVMVELPDGAVTLYSVAIDSSGRILATGQKSTSGASANTIVVRLLPDGSFDPSFGNHSTGISIVDAGRIAGLDDDFRLQHDHGIAIQEQSDGKIAVALRSVGGFSTHTAALLRLTSSGQIDTGFGSGGVVVADLPDRSYLTDMLLTQEGRILAAGYTASATQRKFLLMRFTGDGNLDSAFGSNGVVESAIGGSDDIIKSIVLQGDKILAAGNTENDETRFDFVVARFLQDGSLDTGFGNNGVTVQDLGSEYDYVSDVIVLPDNTIIAAGSRGEHVADYDTAIVHLSENGENITVDSDNQPIDGLIFVLSVDRDDQAQSLAVDSRGRLLMGQYVREADTQFDFAVLRLIASEPEQLTPSFLSAWPSYSSSYPGSNLIDGDDSTFWIGALDRSSSIYIGLSGDSQVDRIEIDWLFNFSARNVVVYYYNQTEGWKILHSNLDLSGSSAAVNTVSIDMQNVEARYLYLYLGQPVSIAPIASEVRVFGGATN